MIAKWNNTQTLLPINQTLRKIAKKTAEKRQTQYVMLQYDPYTDKVVTKLKLQLKGIKLHTLT